MAKKLLLENVILRNNVFSEEEQIIGTHLGETLYRKEIKIKTVLNNGQNLIPHGISNLKLCTFIHAVSEANQPLPRIEVIGNTISSITQIRALTDTSIVVESNGDSWSSRFWYFTMEYTKSK